VRGLATRPLGDVCKVVGGGTPSKGRPEFYDGDIPWATVGDMQGDLVSATVSRITEDAVRQSATNVIPAGNVVIATRVGLGKVCMLAQDTAINQDLRGVIPLSAAELSERYLFWWFKSIAGRIVAEGTGATVQGVKVPFVKGLAVPVPPRAEQQRIVSILDEASAGIATARENAEKNLGNARALFESHLEFVFSQPGHAWVKRRLDEVARDFGRGKSKHRPRNDPKLYGGRYPFVQTGDVRNSRHRIEAYSQTYNDAGLAQSKLWPAGTLCITIAANIAETGILTFDACFPDSVIGVVADETQTGGRFLEYMLQSLKVHLQALGKGSAQANINLATFANQLFPFPDLDGQAKIVETLDLLDAETQRLESIYQKELGTLDELKRSLLHQAFSGQL
jgi:type I restriction enzyme S subunit